MGHAGRIHLRHLHLRTTSPKLRTHTTSQGWHHGHAHRRLRLRLLRSGRGGALVTLLAATFLLLLLGRLGLLLALAARRVSTLLVVIIFALVVAFVSIIIDNVTGRTAHLAIAAAAVHGVLLLVDAQAPVELILALVQQDTVQIADGPVGLSLLAVTGEDESSLLQGVHQGHLGIGQTNLHGAVHPLVAAAAAGPALLRLGGADGDGDLGGHLNAGGGHEGLLLGCAGLDGNAAGWKSDQQARRRRRWGRQAGRVVVVVRHFDRYELLFCSG